MEAAVGGKTSLTARQSVDGRGALQRQGFTARGFGVGFCGFGYKRHGQDADIGSATLVAMRVCARPLDGRSSAPRGHQPVVAPVALPGPSGIADA